MDYQDRILWYAAPEQRHPLARVAAGCLKNSEYTLSSGAESIEFHDLDEYLTGFVRPYGPSVPSDNVNPSAAAAQLADLLSETIQRAARESGATRMAFLDKGTRGGPVGAILLMASIVERTNMPSALVRLGRRLSPAAFKGNPVETGEGFVVVSDVATSGATIAEAANIIWERGGRVPAAVVVYDRDQGANANLAGIDITLWALYNHSVLRHEHLTKVDRLDMIQRDFAGASATS